jgi:hypothetical protein
MTAKMKRRAFITLLGGAAITTGSGSPSVTISVSGFASGLTKECFCGRQLSPKYLNGF